MPVEVGKEVVMMVVMVRGVGVSEVLWRLDDADVMLLMLMLMLMLLAWRRGEADVALRAVGRRRRDGDALFAASAEGRACRVEVAGREGGAPVG